jgi:hypothetical protein
MLVLLTTGIKKTYEVSDIMQSVQSPMNTGQYAIGRTDTHGRDNNICLPFATKLAKYRAQKRNERL